KVVLTPWDEEWKRGHQYSSLPLFILLLAYSVDYSPHPTLAVAPELNPGLVRRHDRCPLPSSRLMCLVRAARKANRSSLSSSGPGYAFHESL
ncbi:hypothetical protein WG66_002339, partial [Moniliophthora roreri]